MERSSLSRSKVSRRPFFLTTTSSRSWTRSTVVKRPPHSGQCRRRRIAEFSSVGRLSFTCVSSCPQKGQRMEDQSLRWLSVDGKSSAQLADTLSHACLDFGQVSLSGHRIDDFDNELADLPKLGGAKSAR